MDGKRLFIPERVVDQALGTVPLCVEIYDRKGIPAMSLEERKAHFGTGSDTPNVIDFSTGKRRPAVLEDVKRAARLADGLNNVDFIMSMGLFLEDQTPPGLEEKAVEEIYRIAEG